MNGDGGGVLRRVLGPVDATCVVIGAIIGVGIFFVPSTVASLAGSGPLALAAWGIGGGIAMLGALAFAELGGMYARAGAQYDVLRDAYGPLPGFVYVFCNATAIQAGAAAVIAMICVHNLGIATANVDPGVPALVGGAAILVLGLAGANCLGVRLGSGVQNATVAAKLATLLAVSLVAARFGAEPVAAPAAPAQATAAPAAAGGFAPIGAIFAALVPAFFAFGGWQQALWMAGEVRRPRRDVPLAIIGGVLVVAAVYLLVNWAYLRLLGYEGVRASDAIAADAVGAAWPAPAARQVIAGAVAVSAFGVLNAQFLTGPRLLYRMALDGRFFAPFARVHARFGTPVPAIGLIGAVTLALLAVVLLFERGRDAIDSLVTGVVFIDAIFFALTGAALVVLRYRRPDARRSVRVPLYPVVPILFVAGELGMIAGAWMNAGARKATLIAAVWIVAAVALYGLWFRGRHPRASTSST